MGLSIGIAGAIVLMVILAVMMAMTGLVSTIFSIGDVTTQVSELENTISKTDVSMNHVLTLIGSPILNFTLNNDGSEKLWNFDEFDLFVTYDGAVSGSLTEVLSYGGDCLGGLPAQGNWCIQSITGDLLDPGILNSAEEANIRLRVNENLANVNAVVSITTDNGVTDTVKAPYCGPSCYQMIWNVISTENVMVWLSMGSGAGIADELDDNSRHRAMIDLIDMKEWRLLTISADSDGSAICELGVQYSTDNFVTWRGLDNGIAAALSTTSNPCASSGHYVSNWASLNATAQSDVWLRIAGTDDNGGSTNPDFGNIQVQFRSTV